MVSFNPTATPFLLYPQVNSAASPPTVTPFNTGASGVMPPATNGPQQLGSDVGSTGIMQSLIQLLSMITTLLSTLNSQSQQSQATSTSVSNGGKHCSSGGKCKGSSPSGTMTSNSTDSNGMMVPPNSETDDTSTYDGIKIDKTTLNPDEVQTVKDLLDTMKNDPDGSKLLNSLVSQGYSINKDPSTSNIAETRSDQKTITLGTGTFSQDKAYVLEVLGHEMTHAATPDDGDSKNEEALASTLGRRIRDRYEGKGSTYQDANGKDVQFNGGTDDEKFSYNTGVIGAHNLPAYKDLPENTQIFDSLAALGITFDFNTDPNMA
jgi:hypothetical protein